jgi:hypothetical protein
VASKQDIEALELKLIAARKASDIVLLIELCQQMSELLGE